jgi:hypothetical protein
LVILGFELRALCFLGICSMAWAIPSANLIAFYRSL